jgi:chloride channel 7
MLFLQCFVSLGLRHLLVVDAHHNLVGIITRKDLDHAAGHGWWRASHNAEPPNKLVARSLGILRKVVGSSTGSLPVAQAEATNGHAHSGH